ncbi:MAG: hypothetical protein NUV82_01790 [Candidatus Komeilibacteria bacterium]|nr:hypothetical protein [Candidatus Komeilibacteria bacterium]
MKEIDVSIRQDTLSRANNPEKPLSAEQRGQKLKQLLGDIALFINQELKQNVARPDQAALLHNDGTLDMKQWLHVNDGPYAKEAEYKVHSTFVFNKELEFSGLARQKSLSDNPLVQEQMILEYHESKLRKDGEQAEMAITALLYKFLRDDFIVVRSAKYDDYHAGVDMLIINKKTGEVVCGFDEVTDTSDGKRLKKKQNKVIDMALQGGAEVKYGLTFVKQQLDKPMRLVKTDLNNLPTFYLPISKEDLRLLLNNMNYNIYEEPSETECEIYQKMLGYLRTQVNALQSRVMPTTISRHIKNFGNMLTELEQKFYDQV